LKKLERIGNIYMNGKKKTIILFVLFVILMFGASVLYNSLSENYKMDSLVVENEINSSANSSKENDNANTTDSSSENSNTDTTDSSSENNSTNTTDSSSGNNNNTDTASSPSEDSNNMTAPDFTVYDSEGNQVHLSDFFGKPIILNFWASWCGPCKMEMPDFEAAYQTHGDQVHFMIVNLTDGYQETMETAQAYLAEQGYTFPVYFDTDRNAAMTYNTNAIPTTYFIDADGFAVAWAQGALDAERLQMGLDMILGQE